MKLSPDAARRASVSAWSPSLFDDQHGPGARRPGAPQRPAPAGVDLAESLFAPAIADDLTARDAPPAPTAPLDAAGESGEAGPQNWLLNQFGQPRLMEDCCEHWIPSEIALEPVGVNSQTAGPNVESIREAALAVAHAAVLETMRQEADAILDAARRQAAETTQQARRDADEELRRAYQAGLAEARAQAESALQMLTAVVEEAQAWQANLMRRSERITLTLVKDIAARLFGDGFTLDAATLGLAFERALAEAKSLGDLRLRVHPEDLALLGELWPAHQTALRGQRIEMIPDLDIQRGGCFIEGQFGSVDGRLDTQLRAIRERLDEELTDSERPEKAFTPLSPEELAQ